MIKRTYTMTEARLRELVLDDLRKELGHAPPKDVLIFITFDGGCDSEQLLNRDSVRITIALD